MPRSTPRLALGCVMVMALVGCDNVRWGGVDVEIRPPDPPPSALLPPPADVDEERPPEPVETGPLLYLVERSGNQNLASLLPVAEITAEGFVALPTADETPELVARFPLERWEAGTEFLLLDRGRRAGTFVADGTARPHEESCQLRPAGAGRLELRPEALAAGVTRFLAVRKEDVGRPGLDLVPRDDPRSWSPYPGPAELRTRALAAARYTIQRAGIPWPPSIPDILRDVRGVTLPEPGEAVAASFSFGGELALGRVPPSAYGLFVVARETPGGNWTAVWSWHQMARDGKAFPNALAEGGLDPNRAPELLLEVWGEDRRWLALAGEGPEGWDLLYHDPCGDPPARGALRRWP